MREAMGYAAKDLSDHLHKELLPNEIFSLFKQKFENVEAPKDILDVHFKQLGGGAIEATVEMCVKGDEPFTRTAVGNGRLDAVSNAVKKGFHIDYTLMTYQEHALSMSTSSKAIAYVGLQNPDGSLAWGAGVDADIIVASIDALLTAINNREGE